MDRSTDTWCRTRGQAPEPAATTEQTVGIQRTPLGQVLSDAGQPVGGIGSRLRIRAVRPFRAVVLMDLGRTRRVAGAAAERAVARGEAPDSMLRPTHDRRVRRGEPRPTVAQATGAEPWSPLRPGEVVVHLSRCLAFTR
jgi:hypothetical protein